MGTQHSTSSPFENSVSVSDLTVSFGGVKVLNNLEMQVASGETVALLGPNGAGKTTLVDCLQGFRRPDSGEVYVLGSAPWQANRAWRNRIGAVLQDTRLDADLTVAEFVEMTRNWYSNPRSATEVLDSVNLTDLASRRVHRLSGGEKRRLDLALATVGSPEVLFLDEPTSGLDPLAKRDLWAMVEHLGQLGTTILLTSHDIAEVERLADRVCILRAGEVATSGTIDTLRRDEAERRGLNPVDPPSFEDVYVDMLSLDRIQAQQS